MRDHKASKRVLAGVLQQRNCLFPFLTETSRQAGTGSRSTGTIRARFLRFPGDGTVRSRSSTVLAAEIGRAHQVVQNGDLQKPQKGAAALFWSIFNTIDLTRRRYNALDRRSATRFGSLASRAVLGGFVSATVENRNRFGSCLNRPESKVRPEAQVSCDPLFQGSECDGYRAWRVQGFRLDARKCDPEALAPRRRLIARSRQSADPYWHSRAPRIFVPVWGKSRDA
jgi:hypothetical protein